MAQIIGHGSTLQIDTTVGGTGIAGDTWTTVAGITTMGLGSDKVDTHDNTDLGTTGIHRSYISGLQDDGDVSVKMNVVPGDASQLAFLTGKAKPIFYKIVYPGAVRTIAFQGILVSIDEEIPDDKLPTFSGKIKITGAKIYS